MREKRGWVLTSVNEPVVVCKRQTMKHSESVTVLVLDSRMQTRDEEGCHENAQVLNAFWASPLAWKTTVATPLCLPLRSYVSAHSRVRPIVESKRSCVRGQRK